MRAEVEKREGGRGAMCVSVCEREKEKEKERVSE